jgi:hypothetical protein
MNNDTVIDIYKNEEYWEKGQIPKQGRKKKENESPKNEIQITNQLLNKTIRNLLHLFSFQTPIFIYLKIFKNMFS